MRAYIIGIAGFLGSHLAEHLLARRWEVDGCDDLSYGNADRVPMRASWQVCSFLEAPDMGEVHYIFNCAGHARTMEVELWPDEAWDANVRVADRAVQMSWRKGARLIHASSCIIYGPQCVYRAQKEQAEALVGMHPHAVSLRFANLYGCHQSEEGQYPNVLAAMKRAAQHGIVIVDGDGSQTRDFLHVFDAARAMYHAAVRRLSPAPQKTYDICTGQQVAIKDAAECFGVEVVHRSNRKIDVAKIVMDPAPAARDLDFRFHVDPLTGIKEYAHG